MKNSLIGNKVFYRRVFAITIPIMIQNLITNFVGLLDNIMVGRIGTEPMSGVAIVNNLFFVFYLALYGIDSGIGIFTAQFTGKGDHKGVGTTFKLKIIASLIIVAVGSGIFICFGDKLIWMFLHEGESGISLEATFAAGKQYLMILIPQMLPFAITQVYATTLRETGQTQVPMRAGVTAVFVNLVFNWILIYGKLGFPALGVVGAALATFLSRIVEILIIVIWTHRHKELNPFIVGVYKGWRFPKPLLKEVFLRATPLFLNETLWSSAMTLLNQCYSTRGVEVVSAVNISSTVINLFSCATLAMGNALSIMIGQVLGSGDLKRAVDEDRKMIALDVAMAVVVGGIMLCFSKLIPEVYNTTAEVKALATTFIMIKSVYLIVDAFNASCYFTLRCGGKTFITFLFDSCFAWVVNVPIAYCIAHFTSISIVPMFIIINCSMLIKTLLGFILVRRRKWVHNLVENM